MRKQRRVLEGASTLLGACGVMPMASLAQNTVYFSTSSVGQTKSITQWGVEVGNLYLDEALQANGEIGSNSKVAIDRQMNLAAMAGNTPYALGRNGKVDTFDFNYLAGNFGVAPGEVSLGATVPETATISVLSLALLGPRRPRARERLAQIETPRRDGQDLT